MLWTELYVHRETAERQQKSGDDNVNRVAIYNYFDCAHMYALGGSRLD
jgi:hypothetical protein